MSTYTILMGRPRTQCRLCLIEIEESDSVPVTKFTRDVLEVLLLKLNLDVSLNPMMCETCSTKIQKFFDFKCTCLYTEDSIAPYIESDENSTVNLRDIYAKQTEIQISTSIFDERKLCRLCIRFSLNGCLSLDATDEDSSFVKQFIRDHLPEVNLSVTKDPVICYPCYRSMVTHSRFVSDCLAVEHQIEDFRKTYDSDDNSPITLTNVIQYVRKKHREMECSENNTDVGSDLNSTKADTNKEGDEKEVTRILKKYRTKPSVSYKRKIEAKLGTKARELPQLSVAAVCKSCKGKPEYGAVYQDMPLEVNVTLSLLGCKDCIDVVDIRQILHKSILTYGYVDRRSYYCRVCGTKLLSRIAHKLHVLRHKYCMKGLYKCNLCQFETNTSNGIYTHMKQHRVPMKCDYCVFTTIFNKALCKHLRDHIFDVCD